MKLWFALRSMTALLAMCSAALASSTWYVDGVDGSDNNNCKSPQAACKTIGQAISLAHSGDSIMVAAATYSENLTVSINLRITGARASTTIVDGGGVDTVVNIPNGNTDVSLSNLKIRNGFASIGAGISNYGTLTINNSVIDGNRAAKPNCGRLKCFATAGGGILNGSTLTINNSTISGNLAKSGPGGYGGGIYNNSGSTLTINNSTISRNKAGTVGVGGGIFNFGALTINNSTISGNTAESGYSVGGGIWNFVYGTAIISNSTVSTNGASLGGGLANDPTGNTATMTLKNSIVANNSGGNCAYTLTSNGYNLSGDNTCNFNNTGDFNNTDPMLGTLGNYGGSTQTIPLLSGSPAIDAGNPSGCADGQGHLLKTDQRGMPRHDREDTGGCDMGAFERQTD